MTLNPCIVRLIVVVAADVRLCAATAYSRRLPYDHACRAPRLARRVATRAQSARHRNRHRSVRAGRARRGKAGGPATGGTGALCRARRDRLPVADYQSDVGATLLCGAAWPVRADWLGSGQGWACRRVEARACAVVLRPRAADVHRRCTESLQLCVLAGGDAIPFRQLHLFLRAAVGRAPGLFLAPCRRGRNVGALSSRSERGPPFFGLSSWSGCGGSPIAIPS